MVHEKDEKMLFFDSKFRFHENLIHKISTQITKFFFSHSKFFMHCGNPETFKTQKVQTAQFMGQIQEYFLCFLLFDLKKKTTI